MQNDILASLSRLSDAELVVRLKGLVARERETTAQLVAHLAALDTRDVFLREGYGWLFVYCARGVPSLRPCGSGFTVTTQTPTASP